MRIFIYGGTQGTPLMGRVMDIRRQGAGGRAYSTGELRKNCARGSAPPTRRKCWPAEGRGLPGRPPLRGGIRRRASGQRETRPDARHPDLRQHRVAPSLAELTCKGSTRTWTRKPDRRFHPPQVPPAEREGFFERTRTCRAIADCCAPVSARVRSSVCSNASPGTGPAGCIRPPEEEEV